VPITREKFERWLFLFSILCMASPAFTIGMTVLFPHDRVFRGICAVIYFFVGVVLQRAGRLLRTEPHSAMLMIERSYYVIVITALGSICYEYFSDPAHSISLGLLKALSAVPLIIFGKLIVERARTLTMESDAN
jgi:hypothetical protein